MEELNHLFGTCGCQRNQYTVIIPAASASQAQVFFDNGAINRRTQASPLTAWLRIPLAWYHSSTFAHFPDETHATIKKSFSTPAPNPVSPPTRRQFCGYCGTHLTSWSESDRSADYLNVTLGSLLEESLDKLEALKVYGDQDSESESGLVKDDGAQIDDDTHIPTSEHAVGGVDGPSIPREVQTRQLAPHSMSGRGVPYFEEMVENSRLGRIKRQRGGHASADGRSTVSWEVVEIGGEDELMTDPPVGIDSGNGNKRLRMGV